VRWEWAIPAIWGMTSFVSLLGFLLGLYRLRSFRGPALPQSERMTRLVAFAAGTARIPVPRFLLSDATTVPFAFGGRTPTVVLPTVSETWEDERLQAVLLHEMAHLGRNDFASQCFARLVCVLYAWNPLVWRLYALFQAEAEAACDAFAVAAGVPATSYATHLYAIARDARGVTASAALPMARPSATHPLEKRIMNLLKPTRSLTARRLVLALSLPMVIGLAAFCFRPVRAEGSSPHGVPPLNDARAFLKWSMDQYAAAPTFSAKWTWGLTINGTRERGPSSERTLLFATPNRFRITSNYTKALWHVYISDGTKMVIRRKGYKIPNEQYPAPASLGDADGNNMSHTHFGGSSIYRFFPSSGGLSRLLYLDLLAKIDDPKEPKSDAKPIREWREKMRKKLTAEVRFGSDVVVNGEPCKTVIFNGGVYYAERRAIISIRDGFVRRLESYDVSRKLKPEEIAERKPDVEQMLAATLSRKNISEQRKKEAVALSQKYLTEDPGAVTIEEFTEIKPNADIPANAFDISRTDTEP
jgi:hypothetical protein